MNAFRRLLLVVLVLGCGAVSMMWFADRQPPTKVVRLPIAFDSAWCEKIYHRNVGCPGFGRVAVPKQVLAAEAVEHLKWCESIYHRNVGCPKFGHVKVPDDVLAQEDVQYRAWCDEIGHRNVSCPRHRRPQ